MDADLKKYKPGEISLIDRAIGFAARAHEGQRRKTGFHMPYIAHPFGVAMILQQMGCTEKVVAAGLLHDTVEDTKVKLSDIRSLFGNEVADIVELCTEPPKKRYSWEQRKRHMILILKDAPIDVKLVMAADKYHNLSHTLSNIRYQNEKIWKNFGRDKENQAWYYRSVYKSIVTGIPDPAGYPIFEKLKITIDTLFAGTSSKPP